MSNTNYSLSEGDIISEEKSSSNKQNICGLCNTNVSKYCCPRCEVYYCSLDCYKSEKHNECSESFYKDCVHEELGFYQNDDESKQKMIDILKRMQNQDVDIDIPEELLEDGHSDIDSDDDEHIDLHDRIKDLNLDDPDAVWSALTEDERNDFESLLNQGDVGSIIPQWKPWWVYRKEEKLVEDMNNHEKKEIFKDCPQLKTVPPLSSLTRTEPSPSIKFNITNIIASYTLLMRYFNGEIDAVEGTICLLNICSNLDTNMNFEDLATAVESVTQKSLQSNLIETDKNSIEVMKHDTFLVLQGPSKEKKLHYCKAVLSHIHSLLTKAKDAEKNSNDSSKSKSEFSRKFPEHKRHHLPNLDISKVKRCLKKLEYYLSYIESFDVEF